MAEKQSIQAGKEKKKQTRRTISIALNEQTF